MILLQLIMPGMGVSFPLPAMDSNSEVLRMLILLLCLVIQGYIQDCMDVGDTNGPRSSLFSIFTATFLVMGLSFMLVPELTKTGMFGAQPRLAAEDRLMWQMIGAAIATVVSPVACTQQVIVLTHP